MRFALLILLNAASLFTNSLIYGQTQTQAQTQSDGTLDKWEAQWSEG